MQILVVGAGALGGYFGGCLAAEGRDVTFLVRQHRTEALARSGLQIVSPHGDVWVQPKTVMAGAVGGPYDLILLAVKAYSLQNAMDDFAPAVSAQTTILPVINGMRHVDDLAARFGAERVLGGVALISASLDAEGHVVLQLPAPHDLIFGELSGEDSPRIHSITKALGDAGFPARASNGIVLEMWEKWFVLATTAGITCLMRASIGDILATPDGCETILGLLAECHATAEASGYTPRPEFMNFVTRLLTKEGSPLVASMLRDIENGHPAEGEHILADFAARARVGGVSTPVLDLACCHVSAYTIRKQREAATA